jgi:hypothetical protein
MDPPRQHVIHLHRQAPSKPAFGASCNGCGVCCAAAPCPLGALVSGRVRGRCRALQFSAPAGRYVCGVASAPKRWLRWLPAAWARPLALRWISAGQGCDATLETGSVESKTAG